MNHRYLAGPADKLAGLFPGVRDDDKRQLPDGVVIVEADLDDFKLASMEADADLTVMTHEEAIDYVGQFEREGAEPISDAGTEAGY